MKFYLLQFMLDPNIRYVISIHTNELSKYFHSETKSLCIPYLQYIPVTDPYSTATHGRC